MPGYQDLMSIAVENPKVLAEVCEIGEATAAKIIAAAKEAADVGGFESGDTILERRKKLRRLTSSSKAFDELLGGGRESQAIHEFFGEFGSGKTQMRFQLAVNATMPTEKGGLDGDVGHHRH
jgi:DNA repair protein RadA